MGPGGEEGAAGNGHSPANGVRIGEASNPGPCVWSPWEPDPDHTSRFAIFGEGWVVLVFGGFQSFSSHGGGSFRASGEYIHCGQVRRFGCQF